MAVDDCTGRPGQDGVESTTPGLASAMGVGASNVGPVAASSAATPAPRDLRYCLDVLHPEANRLEAEQWACIGVPWRFFRWRRANKAHKAINEQWRRILAGQEVAP